MTSASAMLRGLSRAAAAALPVTRRSMSGTSSYAYKHLEVTQPSEFVFSVALNRPEKMNALNNTMWEEIGAVFDQLAADPDCRAVVLSGNGKIFTSGIDLSDLSSLASIVYGEEDVARKASKLYATVRRFQQLFSRLEACPKPVIAAVHSACVGGGVDLLAATDIRVCTRDAWFQVKEVDMGLAADVGTLQRLPKIIGSQSLVNDLCLTARKLPAAEAATCGLVSTVYDSREEMMAGALALAATIASKSPVAVQGTKTALIYARDHSVEEGLEQVARHNMAMLQSEDLMKAAMSQMDKSSPPAVFAKL